MQLLRDVVAPIVNVPLNLIVVATQKRVAAVHPIALAALTKKKMTEDRGKIASLITRLGDPPAINLLDPLYRVFMVPDMEGFIGYRLESNCAVVVGNPVCTDKEAPKLALAFYEHCQKNGWSTVYLIVSEQFCQWAVGKISQASIQFGEELIVDPSIDSTKGRKGGKLRWKMHKAIEEGVVVSEYIGHDADLEDELEMVSHKWLKERKGPQIYLCHVDLFLSRHDTRWFYAKKEDLIVGLLMINRIEKEQGWVLNILMVTPEAPVGTSENLILSVIEKLREEHCRFFSLGAGCRNSLGDIVGLNPVSTLLARGCFKVTNWLFHLRSRRRFLKKLFPSSRPLYLLCSHSKIGFSELFAIKKVTNTTFFTLF
jgi:phosphatidylglycerol lysyltransferase